MDKVMIIGSGASGVHFALSVLRKGYEVTMLDVGYNKQEVVNPDDNLIDLKMKLNDPVRYFLGQNYEAVIYPDNDAEYYGFPPSKKYVFSKPSDFRFRLDGFAPICSFAQGGLAEAWTGGVYPFNDSEFADYPFKYGDIEPYYSEVANRIGVIGVKDDLERFFPFHNNLTSPLDLDEHSEMIMLQYEKHRGYLNENLKCYLGRSRIATLNRDRDKRKACHYCGRCIWGCPSETLYTPLITLKECQNYPNFKYITNIFVSHFKFNSKRQITGVVAESLDNGEYHELPVDKLVLAAGTLSSSKIFMDSILENTGEIIKLHGLMDNRQILMPFVNLRMIGKAYKPDTYQYHQISMEIENEKINETIHAQITTLKTAMIHPIVQSIPFDLKTSVIMFRNLHAALGIASVSFHDNRRKENYLTLEADKDSSRSKLAIKYSLLPNDKMLIKDSAKKVARSLRRLGCIAPSKMKHIRPMGANIHYAGTIPMSTERNDFTASEYCQSHDFNNLYFVDGTTFPWLPAKNLTFTLMANAVRVAEHEF